MPTVQFELAIANDNNTTYAATLRKWAADLPNVNWRGAVSRSQLPDLYRRSTCLVCTSLYESFPNTFLEAWSHGRPVISSVDPDDIICRFRLGSVVRSVRELVTAIERLIGSPTEWEQAANNARCYFNLNHSLDRAMAGFERHFLSVLDR